MEHLHTGDAGAAQEGGSAVTLGAETLLVNDADVDADDTLTVIAVSTSTAGAQVSLVDGNVVYAPGNLFRQLAQGAATTDTFTYTIADKAGATSTATVTMHITGINDAPVTTGDIANVQEDGALLAQGNVLANDSDAATDGMAVTPAQLNIVVTGANDAPVTRSVR